MKKASKIVKEMTISEVVHKYPKTASVFIDYPSRAKGGDERKFIDYGLHCIGCPSAVAETVEEAAKVHQIDLKKLLRDLNKAAK